MRGGLVALAAMISLGAAASFSYYHSSYWNRMGFAPDQPVLFSHRHHAGELRMDCRFCHGSVETSAFAGMPETQTCLKCHSQIFRETPMLRPVVVSAETGEPLRWSRVTALPDHVHFNHSIHIAKGVACITCHGEVGAMALTAKRQPLTMRWCVDCHRDPAARLSPPGAIFAALRSRQAQTMQPSGDLMRFYRVHTEHLTNCSTCHR